MSDNGSIFTCKNHPNKRWANTGPGKRIFFLGEFQEDGSLKRDQPISSYPPVRILQARLNGRNPYDARLEEEPITEWQEVLDFVEYVRKCEEKYAFECACPGSDLVTLEDETYESVTSKEQR